MHSGMHRALEALGDLYEFGVQRGLAEAARFLYQESDAVDGGSHLHDGLNDGALTAANECGHDIDDGWLIGDAAGAPDVPFDLDQFDTAGLDDIYAQGMAQGVTDAVEAIRELHDRQPERDPDERPDYCDGLAEAQRRLIEQFGIDDPDPDWSAANATS